MSEKVCDHHGSVVQRRRPAVGGGCYVQGQCTICRASIGPKARVALGDPLAQRAPSWLPERQPTAKKRRQAKSLKTRRWQELRLEVLARDGYICQCCEGHADQVHHLPSAVYGAETEDQLVASCGPCNQLEREFRIKRAVLG